jgi:hypothetical protein
MLSTTGQTKPARSISARRFKTSSAVQTSPRFM